MTDVIEKIKTQTPKEFVVAHPSQPDQFGQWFRDRGRPLEDSQTDPETTTGEVTYKATGGDEGTGGISGTPLQIAVVLIGALIALVVVYHVFGG